MNKQSSVLESEKKISLNSEIIFEFIRNIKDPEKDYTIEDLNIINEDSIRIIKNIKFSYEIIEIIWTPTTPNCHLALNIGLSIRKKIADELENYLKEFTGSGRSACNFRYKYKLNILVEPGKHVQEDEINRQLNDKERYCAAIENPDILKYINQLIN
jgi:metal-sulfur cluster biosynthetic enzyme